MGANESDAASLIRTLSENPALLGQIRTLLENAQRTSPEAGGRDEDISAEEPRSEEVLRDTAGGAFPQSGGENDAKESAGGGGPYTEESAANGEIYAGGEAGEDSTRVEKSAEKGIPVLRSLFGQEKLMGERREQLLRALKPYLSDARSGMIDTAITVGKMFDSVRRA